MTDHVPTAVVAISNPPVAEKVIFSKKELARPEAIRICPRRVPPSRTIVAVENHVIRDNSGPRIKEIVICYA
jgi:hypothetical protein